MCFPPLIAGSLSPVGTRGFSRTHSRVMVCAPARGALRAHGQETMVRSAPRAGGELAPSEEPRKGPGGAQEDPRRAAGGKIQCWVYARVWVRKFAPDARLIRSSHSLVLQKTQKQAQREPAAHNLCGRQRAGQSRGIFKMLNRRTRQLALDCECN